MTTDEIIAVLEKYHRKWRREITKEHKFQKSLREKYTDTFIPGCYEKSVGIDIAYSHCSTDIKTLLKKLKNE